jgi:hypothetical protein
MLAALAALALLAAAPALAQSPPDRPPQRAACAP